MDLVSVIMTSALCFKQSIKKILNENSEFQIFTHLFPAVYRSSLQNFSMAKLFVDPVSLNSILGMSRCFKKGVM